MGIRSTVSSLLRRNAARYPVVENRATLAWWNGPESCHRRVILENISLSGALLVLDEALSLPEEVWLRLEMPKPTEWAHANVVGTSTFQQRGFFKSRKVLQHVRLKFNPACPFDLFKAATHGHSLNEHFQEGTSPEFDSRTWR